MVINKVNSKTSMQKEQIVKDLEQIQKLTNHKDH